MALLFYDALIAHCALKARAETLLTWNVRDFTRLGSAIARITKTPLEMQENKLPEA